MIFFGLLSSLFSTRSDGSKPIFGLIFGFTGGFNLTFQKWFVIFFNENNSKIDHEYCPAKKFLPKMPDCYIQQLGVLVFQQVLLPSELHGWSPGKHFWLFCILSCSKHCSRGSGRMNRDDSSIFRWIFTLLRVWGYEIGIPNQYTGFKTALDTALDLKQCFFYLFILLRNIRFASFIARHLWKRIVLKNCVKNNWKKKICGIPHTCRKGSSLLFKKSTNQTFTFISSKLVFFKSLWSTHI